MLQMILRSVKDAPVAGKRVLLRVDFNVPLKNGEVVDDWRIRATLPTLELLHKNGAQAITLISHLGRPKGKDKSCSLAPVEKRLRELTKIPLKLQENLRFDPREEANDPTFAKELASLGDIYVNEAFAASHREHASIVGVAKLLPSFAGLVLQEEISRLSEAREPTHPALAFIGGVKFETKEPLLQKLLSTYDKVLLGGALGSDMLKARGLPVGESLTADGIAPTSLATAEHLVPPEDLLVVNGGKARAANTGDVRKEERIVDIGPKTATVWSEEVATAQFVLWNGPLGIYEAGYTQGTDSLAAAIVKSSCRAVIGGGDTIAAIMKHSFDPSRVFLSTGGGAMLEFLTVGTLPGLEILKK